MNDSILMAASPQNDHRLQCYALLVFISDLNHLEELNNSKTLSIISELIQSGELHIIIFIN